MEAVKNELKVRRLSWTNSIPVAEMREMLGVEAPQTEKLSTCEVCDIHCATEEKLAMHREFSKTHETMTKLAEEESEKSNNLPIPPPPVTTTTTSVSSTMQLPPTPPKKENKQQTTYQIVHQKDNRTKEERLNSLVDGKSPNRNYVNYVAPPPPKNYRNTKNIDFSKSSQKLKKQTTELEGQAGEVCVPPPVPATTKGTDVFGNVEAIELWKTVLSTLTTCEEDPLMTPRSLPFIGSDIKLFRFITAQCDVYGDESLVKVVAFVGTSDKEITLLLDRKSIEAKIESNKELSTIVEEDKDIYERSKKAQKNPVFEFILSRLQMNSKGELILIETANDSLCDTKLKVYNYVGVSSDLFETKKTVISKKKETVVVDETEVEKLKNAVTENLTKIRRKSLEALNAHEDITKQMTSLSTISSEGS